MSKKISDFEVYNENPFQANLKTALKWEWRIIDPDRAKPMVDADTGETVFLSGRGNAKLLLKDNAEFTKVFHGAYEEVRKLSVPGVQLLMYVFTLLKKDIDWVKIDIGEAMASCNYKSRTNVYLGLTSLLEGGFISRKTGGASEYYINVNLFFNGKRTNLEYGSSLKERLVSDAKKGRIRESGE